MTTFTKFRGSAGARSVVLMLLVQAPATGAAQGPASAARPMPATTRVMDGITVMEHAAEAFARAPRLTIDTRPLAVAGGSDGDPNYDLTYAGSVQFLPDNRIAALAIIGARLMVFGADGKPEWVLNRMGRGPGDLMAPRNVVWLGGDTLILADAANQRLNWAIPGQGIVTTQTLAVGSARTYSTIAGRLPGNRLVMHSFSTVRSATADTVARPLAPLGVLDAGRDSAREIARIPGHDMVTFETRFRGRPMRQRMTIRFAREAHAIVWDTLIATGSGEGYVIDLRDADGRIVASLRVRAPRRPVTQAARDAQIAAELRRFEGPQAERMVDANESRRIAREQPFADSLPPYSGFFTTRGGTLWVVDAIAPSDSGWSATAFRRDGAIMGRLAVSGRGRPLAFADDRVAVRTEDEDGVVGIRVYRIRGMLQP